MSCLGEQLYRYGLCNNVYVRCFWLEHMRFDSPDSDRLLIVPELQVVVIQLGTVRFA